MKNLTNKDFTLIKTLVNADVKTVKIAEITGRSHATISRIRHFDTFADYRKAMFKINKEIRERVKPLAELPAPIPTELKHGVERPAPAPATDSITITRDAADEIMQKLNFIITHMVVDPNRKAPEDKNANKVHRSRLAIFS